MLTPKDTFKIKKSYLKSYTILFVYVFCLRALVSGWNFETPWNLKSGFLSSFHETKANDAVL